MADIYVDKQGGDDGTGDGSSGNPYATIQHATTTHGHSNVYWIANTEAQIGEVDCTPFDTMTFSQSTLFRVWDIGELTAIVPSGTIPAWHWEGDSDASPFFSPTLASYQIARHVNLRDGKLSGFVSSACNAGWRGSVTRCEIDGTGATNALTTPNQQINAINCKLTGIVYCTQLGFQICDCEILGFISVSVYAIVSRCLIVGTNGILSTNGVAATNNTIVATTYGIQILQDYSLIRGNVIAGASTGIRILSTADTQCLGENYYWDVDTIISNLGSGNLITQEDQIEEVSDPFFDSANDDYRLLETALAAQATCGPAGACAVVSSGGGNVLAAVQLGRRIGARQ